MKQVKRLYDQFRPKHYILDLHPDKNTMTFKGTVVMSGHKVGRPSQRLTLHQKGLKVTKAHLVHHTKTGDVEVAVDRINHHASFDEVRLHTKMPMSAGSYTLSLSFSGKITRAMNGLYPCYFEHDGKQKVLLGTQFESHHAREVFPCIDEPAAKATFDLSLTTPAGEAVIANTPVKHQETKDDLLATSFERTPHMSTYLLAFIVGELGYLERKTKHGVQVRTYATPDNVKHTEFALDVAVKVLDFYNDYFAIDYPLDKCDMIALPDFASGAMENWGCITYREHALLVDPDNTSLASKQYVAMVVAHELAHQWFGNLVTMEWWTDLWLNEGFASWIEYMAVDHLYPEWQMWTQFIVDEQQQGLKLDALEFTHAVEVPIKHPDEIRTIFDVISYSKGSSVIHMLHEYLGPKDFQAGLRYYLKKHAYANTQTNDLWDALEEVSHKPVRSFMNAWTSQPGYPIVQANIDDEGLTLAQERFYLNPVARKRDKAHIKWPIALLSNDKSLPELIKSESVKQQISNQKLKLNVGQSGFYRVSYNASHVVRLGAEVQHGHLDTVDRMGILADTFEAAKAGFCDTTQALQLLESYRNESDSAVWDVISLNLGSMRNVMNDEGLRSDMQPYVRKLIKEQLSRLGWDPIKGESHFDRLLRPTILGMAAISKEPSVVKEAMRLFKQMHEPEDVPVDLRAAKVPMSLRGNAIDPDMRGVVYGTAARNGDKATFEKLLEMHKETTSSEEKLNLCAALCGFKQPELIARSLALITSEHVRLQDVAHWLVYSFGNRYSRQATWEWTKENWAWLEKNLGSDLAFYRLPIYAARAYSDESFLPEFKEFFQKHMSTAFERNVNQAIEIIEWQSAWRKRDLKLVKTYFSAQQS